MMRPSEANDGNIVWAPSSQCKIGLFLQVQRLNNVLTSAKECTYLQPNKDTTAPFHDIMSVEIHAVAPEKNWCNLCSLSSIMSEVFMSSTSLLAICKLKLSW